MDIIYYATGKLHTMPIRRLRLMLVLKPPRVSAMKVRMLFLLIHHALLKIDLRTESKSLMIDAFRGENIKIKTCDFYLNRSIQVGFHRYNEQ